MGEMEKGHLSRQGVCVGVVWILLEWRYKRTVVGDDDGEMDKGQDAEGLPAMLWSLEFPEDTAEPLNLGIDKEVIEKG